jgi:4-amino-4-deoxy-L-arabinose transferase-like glycosyltransferase
VGKILAGQETHGAPPGYYLALFSITLWPATLFALPAFGHALVQRAEPAFRFLLAWVVPSWLLFELVPTKLPHYILPVYPGLAILAAVWVTTPRRNGRWERALQIIAAIVFGVVALAAAVGVVLIPVKLGSAPGLPAVLAAVLVLALAAAALFFQSARRNIAAAGCALASALLLYPVLSSEIAPNLNALWMSRAITAHVAFDRLSSDPSVILAGYAEPSVVFLLGTDTRLATGKTAGAMAAQQGGLAIVEDRDRRRFLESLHAAGGKERAIDQMSGFDYSRGRSEHLTFYRVSPVPADTMPPPE